MNYKTIDELNNFDFSESVISEVETMNGTFHLWLDNVTILPECSCNRDIRVMRANGFLLSVSNPGIQEFIEEGYKRYNADNVLQESVDDRILAKDEYAAMFKTFPYGTIYSIKKKENTYVFSIDANDICYEITVSGSGDVEEWDRFLVKE